MDNVAGVIKPLSLDLIQVVNLEDLQIPISFSAKDRIVIELQETVNNVCCLYHLNHLEGVQVEEVDFVSCTPNEHF